MTNTINPRLKSHIKTALYIGGALWLGTVVTAGSFAAWKLSQGPMDGTFAIPLIERSLKGNTGLNFDLSTMQLVWKQGKNPLSLDINGVTVSGSKGTFLSLNKLGIQLNPIPLLWGQLDIANADIHDIRLRITRLPDGKITLTGSDTQSHTQTTSALTLNDLVTRLPDINHITLKNSSIVLEDQKDAIVRHFHKVDMAMAKSSARAITGYITAPLTDSDTSGTVAVDFNYNTNDQTLNAAMAIDHADIRKLFGRTLWRAGLPIVDMTVDGRANLTLNNNFLLQDLSIRLKSDGGALSWPRYFDDMPIQTLTNFELDLGYVPETQTLKLQTAQLTAKGLTINASGTLTANENWHQLDGNLNLNIPVLAVDLLPEIWPKKWDMDAREWLVDKMSKGRFANINVHVPVNATLQEVTDDDSRKWNITTGDVTADFDFTGITVDYNAPMLPAQNVTGKGKFDVISLNLDIESANAQGLKITSGNLFFDDLVHPGAGHAHLQFDMQGTASDVFTYLEPEPINYRQKVGFDLNKTKGDATLKVDVKFPTTADMDIDDVDVTATATLTNLETPPLLKGLKLTGDAFKLEASQHHFKLSGEGKLGTAPAKISWHEIFAPIKNQPYASKIELDILADKSLRTAFIDTLDNRITGNIPAKITITKPVTGDTKLSGNLTLTPARIDLISPLNFVKQRGINSTVNFTATLHDSTLKSIDTLTAKGAGLSIESGNITFATDKNGNPSPKTATLKSLVAGDTNADITATWLAPDNIRATISGPSFDARYIMGHSEYKSDVVNDPLSYDLNLKLNKLFITDVPITDVDAAFIGNTAGTLKHAQMQANAGSGHITLNYNASGTPNDSLFVEITDAGAGLYALGINQRVRGGYLRLDGTPVKGGKNGDMQGTLRLENFGVRGAPTLAKLINTLSLPGILNLLEQDTGLKFERAETNVTLLNRDGGLIMQLRDGRTSGATLGLTFEGEIDQSKSTLAIQGTVIPMSGINTALASIPLIGDILTGGKLGSGIFAATYTIKGSTTDPDVMVNPLSVLTPGILRRILFEGTLANDH